MLNRIISFSIKNKLIIGLFTLALVLYGIYQTTRLPIDAVPDITNNQVQVITIAPSFGATDIERLVTFPIEQANNNINGIKEIRSFSRFGLSLVTIVFNDDIDIYWARQQVAERLQQIQNEIPKGIGTPELGPITTGLGEIYQYTLKPKRGYEKKFSTTELRTIQDWIVRRQLLGVDGVAEVSSFGGKLKQYEVAVDANKLQSYHLTINDLFSALEKNNQNTGGAYIEKGPTVLFIRSEGLLGSAEDIEQIAIPHPEGGSPIFVRDVAKVNIGYATRYGAMCYNDEGEVAGAVVMMLKGANSSQVIKNVKERIKQIKKTLPEGVEIEAFLDRTKMVNHAIGTVEKNLMEGALIVIFVLVLFLGNFRAGLLVASVIPLAMLFAIILMNMFGVSGNLMSLGALDFGLIVDGAVIIVEAVMHQLSHSKRFGSVYRIGQQEMDEQVNESASKMMNSAVFGQIIILIVYLPIFSLQGIEGKMFKPMAQTVAFALLGAFILSLTYIPMMSALFLDKKIKHEANFSDRMMNWLERKFQDTLSRILAYPKRVLIAVISAFAISLFVLSRLGGEFIPALEEGDFAVDTRVLTGSNLETTIAYSQKAAHILKSRFPEVEKVVTKIGSGEVPTDPMPMEAGDMMVILKDKSAWTSAKTFPEMAEKMSKAVSEVPGLSTGFQFPVQMRFNELMTGARQDVVCKIFGENLDTLSNLAGKLGRLIGRIDGTQDLFIEPVTGMPQVVINYNRPLIAQYQLSIEDINRVVNTAFAGQSTGMVFEGEKRFDLVVRLDQEKRKSVEDIKNLLIPTPSGEQIALRQVAEVAIQNGPNQIQREDAKRRIVVGFNVRERDVQSIVEELQQQTEQQLKFPAGYYVKYGGSFENLNQAKQRLLIAVPVSLLLIFILLFFAFGSVKQGLLIYTAIPLSAIGGVFALALRSMPFSISAGVGFIALFGVAVLNGIVLIAEFNRLKESGLTDLRRIVLMGTKVRLRPVLMTAFVASLGFLPMAISNGAGAEVQRPLATVVIGGLMLATFLTLFVLPILYIMFENNTFKMKRSIKASVLLLVLLAAFGDVQAQHIRLESALDSAFSKNHSLKKQELLAEYQQKLSKTGFDLPQTALNYEFGNLNSNYQDRRITAIQSFSFPTVYVQQQQMLKSEWRAALAATDLSRREINKNVKSLFYHILLQREKEKLLLRADSLYGEFIHRAELRFNAGESNLLEKAAADGQRGSIRIQLKDLQTEIDISKMRLQLLMNTQSAYEPSAERLKLVLSPELDAVASNTHPAILLFEERVKAARANMKLERSKLMPQLNFGYSQQSIQGIGPDNVFYDQHHWFRSTQIGIGVPVFFRTQQNKIRAAKTGLMIAENESDYQKSMLKTEWQTAWSSYSNLQSNAAYFESHQLNQAKAIIESAERQFKTGDINYLEWVSLINQAIQIQSTYLETLSKLNQQIISIEYLKDK